MSGRLISLLLVVSSSVFSQENCDNSNFESGDLSGWITSGIVEVVSGGMDFYGDFPLAAPGGNFSLKLGNSTTFPQPKSTANKSFLVSSSEPYLIYQYALVNLGFDHPTSDAARSILRIVDINGVEIPCTKFEVFAADGGPPGFQDSPKPPEANFSLQCCYKISYLSWQTLLIDLSPYIGQMVTIELSNEWCIYGPDWGYAYFDAHCTGNEVTQFCIGSNSIGLQAPLGAANYIWNTGETTDNIVVTDPIPGSVYTCTMFTDGIGTGCSGFTVNLSATVIPTKIEADFIVNPTNFCVDKQVLFFDNTEIISYVTTDGINYTSTIIPASSWYWDFGDGQNSTDENTQHSYADSGSYHVSFIVHSPSCVDTIEFDVQVNLTPSVPVLGVSKPTCLGDLVHLYASLSDSALLTWNGPNQFLSHDLEFTMPMEKEGIGTYWAYTTQNQCNSDTAYINVTSTYVLDFEDIQFPNVITCNEDFINDELTFIDDISICQEYSLVILNRWGNVVFEQSRTSKAFKCLSADGTELNPGVYFYKLIYEKGEKSGFIHLVRR